MKRFPLQRHTLAILSITLLLLISVAVVYAQTQDAQAGAPQVITGQQNGRDESPQLASVVSLPVVYKEIGAGPVTPMGVQAYGSTTPNNPFFPFLLESRASWVRIPVRWADAEPNQGDPFDWSVIDNALSLSTEESPRVIGTIDIAPDWAAKAPGATFYPGNFAALAAEFANFAGALVERYDGDGVADAPGHPVVLYWEFYNEPDSCYDCWDPGWGNHPALYAQMLASVYPAVKGANPNAKVVFGGIAYDYFEDQGGPFVRNFLDGVLQNGGGAHFDVMNFHGYPSFSVNWTTNGGPGLREKTIAIRQKLASFGLQKPFVITEAGWHSNNAPQEPSTPEIQARYVTELFVQTMAADVDIMIWWSLGDPPDYYPFQNGLVTNEPSPTRKPSFFAYRTLVDVLGTAQFVQRLGVGQTGTNLVEAYKFNDSNNNKTIYVAWHNPVDTGAKRQLKLAGSVATVRNIYGGAYTVTDGADGVVDGLVTVTVTGQPIYVEFAQ